MKAATTISGATIVTAFGLISSYKITKRVEKKGWKEIEQNVQHPAISNPDQQNSYIHRGMIEKELYKQLESDKNDKNKVNSLVISGPKHFGKTTIIKNAFQHKKLSYIYLDFHDKQLNDNTFDSILEDSMNDPFWYRLLMRKFYPNYHHHLMKRWINSIRTLHSEIEAIEANKDDDNNEHEPIITTKQHIPWILIDGLDINDVIKNNRLKDDILFLNQQLCKDFGSASIVLSVDSESPMKSENVFSNEWHNMIWIGQFESRKHAMEYLKVKLSHLDNVEENELYSIIDFCRLNVDDINYCIQQISKAFTEQITRDSDTINDDDNIDNNVSNKELLKFDDIWSEIKQKRLDFYKSTPPLLEWSDVDFWKGFMNEMEHINGKMSKEFILNACKYLLYDYFTSVVVVGCTAFDIIQHFAGNAEIVNDLYEDGCFTQYGSLVIAPFNLFEKSVLMPSSYPKYKAFEQLFDENGMLSDMALFVSRHYIFTRELNRAQNDIDRITTEIEVFNSAQQYVERQKKELTDDQRAHLEVDILNKKKTFDTKLNEATRRAAYFSNAKIENIAKFKVIITD